MKIELEFPPRLPLPDLDGWIAIAAGLLLALVAGTALAVTPRSDVVVSDDGIRMGDLFDGLEDRMTSAGLLPDLVIAPAPAPGRAAVIDARTLNRLATAYRLEYRAGPGTSVTVRQASLHIDAAEIAAATRASLMESGDIALMQAGADRIDVQLDNARAGMHLPADSLGGVRIESLSFDPASMRFRARAVAPATGPTQARAIVTGRLVRLIAVPVPVRQLGSASVIGPDDVQMIEMDADRIQAGVVIDPADLVGMAPRRSLRAMQPVRNTDIREPVLVSRGEHVTMTLEYGPLSLTTKGRAMQAGARGELIRISNASSGRIIEGVVVAEGLVRVTTGTRVTTASIR